MEIQVETELMIAREKNCFKSLYPIKLKVKTGNGYQSLNISVAEAINLVEDIKSAILAEV